MAGRWQYGCWLVVMLAAAALAACSSMLPEGQKLVRSPWKGFDEAKASYDQVLPFQTTLAELKRLGFDPYTTPNINILSYLDIMKLFNYEPQYKAGLDAGIRDCLDSRDRCSAYDVRVGDVRTERVGSFWADLFRFRRKEVETGWHFRALIFIVDQRVVHKIWSGSPMVNEYKEQKNPLGPLQDMGAPLIRDTVF